MKILKKAYTYLIFIFLYAPIVVLVVYSFNSTKSRVHWTGFSLKWYAELFRDSEILSALWVTLILGVASAVIATVIGTAAAIGIHNMKKLPKSILMNMTYIPVLNPDIVTGVSLMLLFIFIKVQMGFFSLLMAHITFNIPFVILSVLPKLRQFNRNLYEAAIDLGARPVTAFRKIMLPEIMPGVITGMLLAFTLSIDDFVISFFTAGGSGVSNLAIVIYSYAKLGISPKINALSTLMFVTVLILLVFVNRRKKKELIEGRN